MRAERLVVAAIALTATAACGGDSEGPHRPVEMPPPTLAPPETLPLGPTTPEQLMIELDDAGRPYDVESGWYEGSTLVTERVGSLAIDGGELRILDGNALMVDPEFFADEATSVSFGDDVDRVDITIHYAAYEATGEFAAGRQIVAVRLDVPGAGPVERWQPYEPAYGTDGGLGGLTTPAILDGDGGEVDVEAGEVLIDAELVDEYHLGRYAGDVGDDVFVWANGFGDGSFPLTQGLDADRNVVSVVLPTLTYPWRLLVPDGTPPPDVTAREDEYLECLAGTRAVTVDDFCTTDTLY